MSATRTHDKKLITGCIGKAQSGSALFRMETRLVKQRQRCQTESLLIVDDAPRLL